MVGLIGAYAVLILVNSGSENYLALFIYNAIINVRGCYIIS